MPTLQTSSTVDLKPSPIELLRVSDQSPTGRRLRNDPSLRRIRHGVYADGTAWRALRPWQRYLARVHAYALTHPEATLCLESAAALLGLPVFGETRDIHVLDPRRATSARRGDVIVHTNRVARRVVSGGLMHVTDLTDTALDVARVVPPAFGLAVVDHALRTAPETGRDELVERARRLGTPRGAQRLRWVLQNADAASESPAESVSRAVIAWWGFETPELQVTFRHEGAEDRVDFYWRRLRLIGECDGAIKYDDADPAAARRRLLDEKKREDRLRRHEGGMTRWGWADAMRATDLRDRLTLAGVEQVRPAQHAMLATLASHPRSFPPGKRAQQTRDRDADGVR
ncbi:type IV toxin-antitoxin system AbiEi family antitoxin domain-containing protein [Microbacterium sp.]|uniref:type IV toxin-antitoxin system AbiEi family antitoxin domain-containing protein n=1 Tax=Microbacterium sp. TaxID=51671 RepID=UPI003A91550A